jgi:PAS domain S-box-containing protein
MVDQDLTRAELRARLSEAEDTIRAIRLGEVDAVVVEGPRGLSVYTLQGADHVYRVLLENMQEGTVSLDSEGLILYSNPKFAALLGLPVSSVTGSQFRRHVSPADSNAFAALVEAASEHSHISGDLYLRAADGGAIPVRLSLVRVDCDGMQCLSVLVSDQREQRRADAIVKEEQLSRLILNQAGEAIVVIDQEGTILRRSESARSLAGASVMLDRFDRVFPLTISGIPLTASDIVLRTRSGETLRGVEASMAHRDGCTSALLVSAAPLLRDGKELIGCVITLTDITEMRRTRDELARQAQELARSNSDLRQFAYSASHDLREPLRQLAVFSELIQKRFGPVLGKEGGDLIQHAIDGAHRMEKLLQDLLAYIQAADAPQEGQSRTDANEVVRKVLANFEAEASDLVARIHSGQLPELGVHEVHLVQLFQNLIGNALKYRGEAPPEIRIQAEPEGRLWRFSVEDNGIGISPDYQQQIFGLFKRLHGGGKYSGSGIGLAICQKIVQRYGCNIWVESEPGRGSRFCFTLPGGG